MVNGNKNKCNNTKILGRRTGVDTERYWYYFTIMSVHSYWQCSIWM